jgi:hypothetical protein
VFDRKRSLLGRKPGGSRRSRLLASFAIMGGVLAVVVMGLSALVPAAGAATPPIGLSGAEQPLTVCNGGIAKDSSGTNQLDYTFSCAPLTSANNGNILSFVVEAIRPQDDLNNIQTYNGQPNVFYALDNPLASGYSANATGPSTTIDPTAAGLNCQGGAGNGIDGIDCWEEDEPNPSSSPVVDGDVPSGDYVEGDIDLTEPYCAYLPEGAKPGTAAVPQAEIELVVTDSTGSEDGPFELDLPKGCAKVPAVVPAFKLSSVKAGNKSVTVASDLPFTGKLAVKLTSGKTVVGSASEKLAKTGKASLTTKLNSAGDKLVSKAGKSGLAVTVKATYSPTHGKNEVVSHSGLHVK